MTLTRRVTFRLYPTRPQEKQLHYWRKMHCNLYNAALYNRKTQYQRFGHSVDYYEQQNCLPEFKKVWSEYVALGSHALQATLKRVDFAYQRFFKGLAKYPKFKASRLYRGWTYPDQAGWSVHTTGDHGFLEISNLGQIRMRGQARTWGTPTTCTIIWKQGKWFASITVNCAPVRKTGTDDIGLDFGCQTAIAMSDGIKVENPRFLGRTQEKIKKVSKQLRRKVSPNHKKRVKGSKRWRKTRKRVSQLHSIAANQRADWQHKVAADIVSRNSLVATEELNVKNMTRKAKKGSKRKRSKAGLNRSILDVAFGSFKQMIAYKLVEAGGFLVEVPTKKVKPSQTCPECGHQEPKTLDVRVHHCKQCGYQEDRDVAAAIVCINYARGQGTCLPNRGSSSSTAAPKYTGGMRQIGELKRHKPRPNL